MKVLGRVVAMMLGQIVVSGPLVLKEQPDVYKGVAAMPQVVSGVTPEVAAKMNAAFKRLDARVGAAAADCRKQFLEQQHKRGDDAWTRGVEVTMRGPRYLSVMATDSYDCGGPYPNDGLLLPIVYDLNTGGAVNWLKLLPPGASSGLDSAGDGSKVGAVIWPVLTKMASAQAEKDCKEAFATADAVSFVLWLDARQGAVEAQPFSFPHAEAACADSVEIPVAQARKMGFNGEMLDALEAAHQLQP